MVRLLDGDAGTFSGLAEELAGLPEGGRAVRGGPGRRPAHGRAGVRGRAHDVQLGVARCTSSTPRGRLETSSLLDEKATVVLLGQRADLAAALRALVDAGRTADAAGRGHGAGLDHQPGLARLHARRRGRRPRGGRRRRVPASARGRHGPDRRPARAGLVVRDQAAVRLAGAGAAHAGAVRPDDRPARRPTARCADVVPTISVEPPRTPHQMEKAVKGLVTGRYEWIGFTSRQRRPRGAGEVRPSTASTPARSPG